MRLSKHLNIKILLTQFGLILSTGLLYLLIYCLLFKGMLHNVWQTAQKDLQAFPPACNMTATHFADAMAKFSAPSEQTSPTPEELLAAEYAAKSPLLSRASAALPKEGDQYATITIERLGMQVPLYYGDTNTLLKKGAGQYIGSGSATFGEGRQILVAGHNTKEFKPLQNAQVGDIVTVSTTYGEYGYQIVRIEIYDMKDSASYDFNLDHEQLAMYTCYPFSGPPGKTQRYFCYCDKLYGPVLTD